MNTQPTPRIVIIVQARMGSTRLPEKIFKTVLRKPLLQYQLERLKRVTLAQDIVVATTTEPRDQQVATFCHKASFSIFCGSEEDVLKRYYDASCIFKADVIVRITGDCPLIDPSIVDQAIQLYLDNKNGVDYVSNTLQRTYPRGMDVEVFSKNILEKANTFATTAEEREHVTPYIWRHPEKHKILQLTQKKDESFHRWTVDTEEDFSLIEKILSALYPTNPTFTKDDIISLLNTHPGWITINQKIKQKPLGTSS